ncbi:uncharacterized protein LOC130946509 [Arachis stenosperma]|uniref:uncharacterized protein LOC130946509 n=1 Tax=Arachis stenosperma TaxID=217475 RepID=UPI0025AC3FFD|nr:uncharacterized protein LOC130946509 [Arachis stenosperma]
MAFAHQVVTALVFVLVLTKVDPSACQLVKGKVSCNDCTHQNYDFSGIKVSVKCEGVKRVAMATTQDNGTFKVDLPFHQHNNNFMKKCQAKIIGGPNHIYARKKNQVSEIVMKGKEVKLSSPLSFFKECPQQHIEYCNAFASSKTFDFDFPFPPEWGLAPSSYYFPYFFPIIGIP